MAQRHWTDRRKAAERRFQLRPKPTPKSVIKAMKVQATEVQDLEDEQAGLMEKLELKIKPEKAKPKGKPVKAGKQKPMPKPKAESKASTKAKVDPKFGEHGHDFNSEED